MTARPAVLPETFFGEGSFVDWLDYFETVVEVGRGQNAVKTLCEEEKADYTKAKDKLMERFQSQRKRPGEDWPSFGEDLKSPAIKAFLDLNKAAKEWLAVSNYISQLDP